MGFAFPQVLNIYTRVFVLPTSEFMRFNAVTLPVEQSLELCNLLRVGSASVSREVIERKAALEQLCVAGAVSV